MKCNLQECYDEFKNKFLKSDFKQKEFVYFGKNNKIAKSYSEAEIINEMTKDLKKEIYERI